MRSLRATVNDRIEDVLRKASGKPAEHPGHGFKNTYAGMFVVAWTLVHAKSSWQTCTFQNLAWRQVPEAANSCGLNATLPTQYPVRAQRTFGKRRLDRALFLSLSECSKGETGAPIQTAGRTECYNVAPVSPGSRIFRISLIGMPPCLTNSLWNVSSLKSAPFNFL